MGKKIRYIIPLLFLTGLGIRAQEVTDFRVIDSLTYNYYMKGSWDSLLKLGNDALDENIDYKYLRQRLGFAYFSLSRFTEAQKQLTKALEFDSFDTFTIKYLYLSLLYSGNEDGASVIAGKMTREMRESLAVTLFNPIESVEAEYNFKYAGTDLRSHPQYFRFGLSTRLGSRATVFQMFSRYSQTITVRYPAGESYISDAQPEYYVLLKYSLSPYLKIKTAYHYMNTSYSLAESSAHLGYLSLSGDYYLFRFGAEYSYMNINDEIVTQTGLIAGLKGQGQHSAYLTGELSLMTMADSVKGMIYDQKVGLKASPKFWIEGNVTFGNLYDFNEFSAMYIYNTVDPTTFRCGTTLFFFPGSHLSFWFNFSYEKKNFYENTNYYYNQFSYLGGIKWKIIK